MAPNEGERRAVHHFNFTDEETEVQGWKWLCENQCKYLYHLLIACPSTGQHPVMAGPSSSQEDSKREVNWAILYTRDG